MYRIFSLGSDGLWHLESSFSTLRSARSFAWFLIASGFQVRLRKAVATAALMTFLTLQAPGANYQCSSPQTCAALVQSLECKLVTAGGKARIACPDSSPRHES